MTLFFPLYSLLYIENYVPTVWRSKSIITQNLLLPWEAREDAFPLLPTIGIQPSQSLGRAGEQVGQRQPLGPAHLTDSDVGRWQPYGASASWSGLAPHRRDSSQDRGGRASTLPAPGVTHETSRPEHSESNYSTYNYRICILKTKIHGRPGGSAG